MGKIVSNSNEKEKSLHMEYNLLQGVSNNQQLLVLNETLYPISKDLELSIEQKTLNALSPDLLKSMKVETIKLVPKIKNATLVTIETRDLQQLLAIHNKNISEYANFHGYQYNFYTKIESVLPVYWWKIQLAQKILEDESVEYFVWLDSDTIIKYKRLPLETIISINPDASIYIGKDYPCSINNAFCAGVFIIKNNYIGKKFISDCLDIYLSRDICCKNGKYTLDGAYAGECYEQGIMNELLNSRYAKYVVITPPCFISNKGEIINSMICHVYGDKQKCLEIFNNFVKSDFSLPVTINPTPPKICILITTYASFERKELYINNIMKWLTTGLDLYVVDSAGLNLLKEIDPKINYYSFKQDTPEQKINPSVSEKNSILKIYEHYKKDFLKYDIILKVTGKYFISQINELIPYVPTGTELIIQNQKESPYQNTEYIGMAPELITTILNKITQEESFEKVIGDNLPNYKYIRFPPIVVDTPVKRSLGDILPYL